MTARIAFFDTKPYDRASFDEVNARKEFEFEIEYFETRLTPRSVRIAEGFDVVCAFVNDDLSASTINGLIRGGVRLIAMRCAGYNNVNLGVAYGKIPVVRVPAYSPYAVAEYTLGLILTLNRKIHRAYCRVREGNFSIAGFLGFDLRGKTLGIVGTGKIGLTLARVVRGVEMNVLGYDPYPNTAAAADAGVSCVSLEQLLESSDIVSLHCPLTPDNMRLIDASALARMKPGTLLVNTSRGKLIDTAAVIGSLKSGHLGGAALDVYEEETDYFFEDRSDSGIADDMLARLMTFPNVIVTSHQAFFTREAVRNIAETTLGNIRDFILGHDLVNAVCYHCDGSKNCPGKEHGSVCP